MVNKNIIKKILDSKKYAEMRTKLTSGQNRFVEGVLDGRNVGLTGSAGTGKSFAVECVIKLLEDFDVNFGITSTTGISALTIGGTTIHSFMGMGLCQGDFELICSSVKKNRKVVDRIKFCDILLIDELSMMSGRVFEIVDKLFREIRKRNTPFGGVQIVCSFDVMQLPPIFNEGEEEYFFWETESWQKGEFGVVQLDEVVRQKDDEFVELLENIRFGREFDEGLIKSRIGAKLNSDTLIYLYATNRQVDSLNKKKLVEIKSKSVVYNAIDDGSEHNLKVLEKNCPAPKKLELKVGAQVMLLKNLSVESGLCNGSIGKVVELAPWEIKVKFGDNIVKIVQDEWAINEQVVVNGKMKLKKVASRLQLPLKLAWAISIHKSQSITLENAIMDLGNCFERGQVYVALSRVKGLNGLSIEKFNANRIEVNQKAVEFVNSLV